MKLLSNTKCIHSVLGEIRDADGVWHSGFMGYTSFAARIGTTTSDLMRRLKMLNIVRGAKDRSRPTPYARQKRYMETYYRKRKGQKRLCFDVLLPGGMVHVVSNLEATNLPLTREEQLRNEGRSLSEIALIVGISKQAVHRKLGNIPPRLSNWPVLGAW